MLVEKNFKMQGLTKKVFNFFSNLNSTSLLKICQFFDVVLFLTNKMKNFPEFWNYDKIVYHDPQLITRLLHSTGLSLSNLTFNNIDHRTTNQQLHVQIRLLCLLTLGLD